MGGVVEQFIPEVLEAQRTNQRVPEASVQFLADGLGSPRIIGSADVVQHGGAELFAGPSNHPELPRLQRFAGELLRAMEGRLLGPGSFDFTGGPIPRFTETNVRETAVTCRLRGVFQSVTGASYDPTTGQFLDAGGRSWHWVGADYVPVPKPVNRAKRAGEPIDGRLIAALAPGSFPQGASVLPTRIDGRGGYGLVAMAPDERANALRAFDAACERLQQRE
ncbi:MAG: hypothetical protein IPL40_12325 [Proteobacteria bacterium]|nr:hypothetical protein [Pseudomonadota bacterium]